MRVASEPKSRDRLATGGDGKRRLGSKGGSKSRVTADDELELGLRVKRCCRVRAVPLPRNHPGQVLGPASKWTRSAWTGLEVSGKDSPGTDTLRSPGTASEAGVGSGPLCRSGMSKRGCAERVAPDPHPAGTPTYLN